MEDIIASIAGNVQSKGDPGKVLHALEAANQKHFQATNDHLIILGADKADKIEKALLDRPSCKPQVILEL